MAEPNFFPFGNIQEKLSTHLHYSDIFGRLDMGLPFLFPTLSPLTLFRDYFPFVILEADSTQAYTQQLDTLGEEESAAEEFNFSDFDRLWSEMHQGFPDGELLACKFSIR